MKRVIGIVEDEKDLNELVKRYLEKEGYEVRSYLTFDEASLHTSDDDIHLTVHHRCTGERCTVRTAYFCHKNANGWSWDWPSSDQYTNIRIISIRITHPATIFVNSFAVYRQLFKNEIITDLLSQKSIHHRIPMIDEHPGNLVALCFFIIQIPEAILVKADRAVSGRRGVSRKRQSGI